MVEFRAAATGPDSVYAAQKIISCQFSHDKHLHASAKFRPVVEWISFPEI